MKQPERLPIPVNYEYDKNLEKITTLEQFEKYINSKPNNSIWLTKQEAELQEELQIKREIELGLYYI